MGRHRCAYLIKRLGSSDSDSFHDAAPVPAKPPRRGPVHIMDDFMSFLLRPERQRKINSESRIDAVNCCPRRHSTAALRDGKEGLAEGLAELERDGRRQWGWWLVTVVLLWRRRDKSPGMLYMVID